MTAADIAQLSRALSDIRAEYEHSVELLASDRARREGIVRNEPPRAIGRDIALESHVRRYLLDPLLLALGWDTSSPENMVIEDAAEAQGRTRRFLDYHGRDCDNGRSFMIVEAKRPNVSLFDRQAQSDLVKLIPQIPACNGDYKRLRSEAISLEWLERIDTLIDYSRRAEFTSKQPPAVALITNGDWFVLFLDVGATLLSDTPDKMKIVVIETFEDLQSRSADLHAWLSYSALSSRVPPQHPSALPDFVPEGADAVCAHVIDVWSGAHGDEQPALSIRVAVSVLTPKGTWVTFQKEYPGDNFVLLSPEEADLARRAETLRARVSDLVGELTKHRNLRFIGPAEAERITGNAMPRSDHSAVDSTLVKRARSAGTVRYRMMIGDQPLYFTSGTDFTRCPFHFWAAANTTGDAAISRPLVAPSVRPISFFANGSALHCTHAAVHSARRDKCLLLDFEQFHCCRRCAYFDRCWPDGGTRLPCRTEA